MKRGREEHTLSCGFRDGGELGQQEGHPVLSLTVGVMTEQTNRR